ncbi:hypothetical protein BHM03_00042528, partial [Ensete ventricosum]
MMLPLRFPNSGIRAKVVRAKIDFKLRVMRLNHVELFYTFVTTIGNDGNITYGRGVATCRVAAMGRPLAVAAGHGHATARAVCC